MPRRTSPLNKRPNSSPLKRLRQLHPKFQPSLKELENDAFRREFTGSSLIYCCSVSHGTALVHPLNSWHEFGPMPSAGSGPADPQNKDLRTASPVAIRT